MELVERTKKFKSGEWCNDKARNYATGFNEKEDAISRATQSPDEGLADKVPRSPVSVDDNAIYLEVVGSRNKKGYVYGLGHMASEFVSSSSGTPTPSYADTIPPEQFNQMQDTISQLNAELREKRDSEQRMAEQIAQLTQAHQQLMQRSVQHGQTLQLVLEQLRIQPPVANDRHPIVVPPLVAAPVLSPPAADDAASQDDDMADVGGTDAQDDWVPPPLPPYD